MAKNKVLYVQKTERHKWSDDSDRLIIYADFMGFKDRIYSKDHGSLRRELEVFREKWNNKSKPLYNGDYLKFVQFSDSILIVANGVDYKMMNLLSRAAICLMHTALNCNIPIKGAIAQGKFTYDQEKELYFGKPLVDAYLLHEEIKYYGIVVHHSAEKTVRKYNHVLNAYLNTDIYLKSGKVSHYHLCWNLINQQLSAEDITQRCEEWLDCISETVSGAPRMYIDRTRYILKCDSEKFNPNEDKDDDGVVISD